MIANLIGRQRRKLLKLWKSHGKDGFKQLFIGAGQQVLHERRGRFT